MFLDVGFSWSGTNFCMMVHFNASLESCGRNGTDTLDGWGLEILIINAIVCRAISRFRVCRFLHLSLLLLYDMSDQLEDWWRSMLNVWYQPFYYAQHDQTAWSNFNYPVTTTWPLYDEPLIENFQDIFTFSILPWSKSPFLASDSGVPGVAVALPRTGQFQPQLNQN